MKNALEEAKQAIQWVLDNKTSYEVAKELGINNRTINRYQNGTSDLNKMTLETAEKIYSYYLKEMEIMTTYLINKDTKVVLTLEEWREIGIREFTEKWNDEKEDLLETFEDLQDYLEWAENMGYFFTDLIECDADGKVTNPNGIDDDDDAKWF